jgi:transcriptional regulator with XRE-family HTH domain
MSTPLSENLARLRKSRDLSQEELAEAAGVGVDTIGRIERGTRRATRAETIAKIASALRVKPAALRGDPSASEAVNRRRMAKLRHAITASEEIPGLEDFTDNSEVLSLPTLIATAHKAWRAYVDGEHDELLEALPELLVDARRFVHVTRDDRKAAGQRVLSTAYRLGAGIVGRHDLEDLAWTSAERALRAARKSDVPDIEEAISLRYLVWTLVRQGSVERAERVAVKAAEQIEPRMLDRDPARAGVFGNLLFNAASAALRAGRARQAEDLLAVAQSAAVRSGRDVASEKAIFGPRVAALQAVDHALRLGDPEAALRLAERVPAASGEVPAFWEAGHRLHLGAAAAELRRDKDALGYLAQARDLAPDWVRHQPLGESTMRLLVDRAPRRRGKRFAALATHYGVAQPPELDNMRDGR